MQASRKEADFDAAAPAAIWSISTDGKVQRSTNNGKSYEAFDVSPGIGFRAIAALGNDVWAGGADGALFHSADAGTSWSRISIHFKGGIVTETIAAILLHDPQHLTVYTVSDVQYVSKDGGEHWREKR